MLQPGAHSGGPGEDGKSIPVWVEIFGRYFELKKNVVSKTAQQKQQRTVLRNIQNTILPPPESLGDECATNELASEVAVGSSSHPNTNSLVALGGTLMLEPVSLPRNSSAPSAVPITAVATSTATTQNFWQRTSNHRLADSHGRIASGFGEFSTFFDVMSRNARAMMNRPIRDVQKDYVDFLNALDKARSDNDEARILFYDTACRNLLEEMRLMSNNN